VQVNPFAQKVALEMGRGQAVQQQVQLVRQHILVVMEPPIQLYMAGEAVQQGRTERD